MSETAWLALVTALLTLIGSLAFLGYKDMSRRLTRLEEDLTIANAAIIALLVSRAPDVDTLAVALHKLLIRTPFGGGD